MVDGLLFEDQMDDVFREYGRVAKNDGQFEFVTLGQYVSQLNADLKNISSSQIAIVYADGAIVDGEGYGADIYGNTLAAKLAKVRRNDDVKAVVLRVNSPGGSALASDVIWREVELLREKKPVIVSMGSYAPAAVTIFRAVPMPSWRTRRPYGVDRGVRNVPAPGGCPEE